MAHVWMKFNLDDEWDKELYERCNKATDLCSAIWSIKQLFREEWRKREGDDKKETSGDILQRMDKEFYEILEENDINLDKIYS